MKRSLQQALVIVGIVGWENSGQHDRQLCCNSDPLQTILQKAAAAAATAAAAVFI